jgi:hypothetical protein
MIVSLENTFQQTVLIRAELARSSSDCSDMHGTELQEQDSENTVVYKYSMQ